MDKSLRRLAFVFFAFTVFPISATAQKTNLDSLWNLWQDETQADTARLNAITEFAWDGYLYSRPDSAFYFAQLQYDFAKNKGLKKYMAIALNMQGVSFHFRGNYPKAVDHYLRSLKLYEETGDKLGVTATLNNIGIIYHKQHDYTKALDYFQRSLKIREEIRDKNGIAASLNNIGLIYKVQEDYAQAIDYFQRSVKIKKEIGDEQGIASSLTNIGSVYEDQGDYSKALDYYQRSLRIKEESKDKKGMANASNNIGGIYNKQNAHAKALEWCAKGLRLAEATGAIDLQRAACKCLYNAHKALGNGNQALAYHEQMLTLGDSLKEEETAKRLQQMEFEKQMLADSISQAEKDLRVQMENYEKVRKESRKRNIAIVAGIFLLIIAIGLYSRVRHIRKSRAAIEKEKERSDNLLLNILPAEIANELKEKGKAAARYYEKVSILFTDFKEFTQTSEKLSAQELVEEINHCFEAFDKICEKYQIEKIKTIGDAYMAAGGLPIPTDGSVKNTVLAGLEMADFIYHHKAERQAAGLIPFEMRVGIHTGPVVAGIVGVKKFQYDVWGDTVNTASRMESHGEVGKVNISQSTYELLKDDQQFKFEPRGKVQAKGKGEVEMWFVSKK